jgi:hypothetical protein
MKPLFALLLFVVPWCNNPLSESTPTSSGPVQIQIGRMAFVRGGTLRFDSLLTDSRCPTGLVCFWAGEAIIRVTWTRFTRTATFPLMIRGGTFAQHTDSHVPFDTLGFRFSLQQLDPYPDPRIRYGYNAFLATILVENISESTRR